MSRFTTRHSTLLALAVFSAACGDGSAPDELLDDGAVVGQRADGGDEPSADADEPRGEDAAPPDVDGAEPDADTLDADSSDADTPDAEGACTVVDCAAASCSDRVQNGDETGIDCGGACAACDPCTDPSGATCAPTAGFTLSGGGEAPVLVTASSAAQRGTSPITEVVYEWGDGSAPGPDSSHRYFAGGTFTVVQRVVDAAGRTASASRPVVITGFTPVRMSSTDQSFGSSQADGSPVRNIVLSDDGRTIEVLGMDDSGVRSDAAVTPGSSRVYYFEGERLFANTADFWGFGVATSDAPIKDGLGSTPDSFGVFTQGTVTTDDYNCAGKAPGYVGVSGARDDGGQHFGFVVDYRGTHPNVYLIAHDGAGVPAVICGTTLDAITKPLYILYAGRRATVGPQARVNTGADTTNHPFFYTPAQIEQALTAASAADVIPALSYGFTRTRALPASASPVLTTSADVTIALGASVTLTATATDAEDGTLTSTIGWADRTSSFSHAIRGSGGSFTFTPVGIGAHRVEASVSDSVGRRVQRTVVVNVTGTLPSFASVRFVDDQSRGQRTFVTADGLGVYFGASGHFKDGVRVNQGLKGDFWYFEATRPPLVAPQTTVTGFGIGLIVGDAELNPYSIYEVPWSMSINTSAGVWKALVNVGNLSAGSATPGNEAAATPTLDRYGFAVDYRGDHPRVHVLVGSGASARFIKTVELDQVDVPIYPFVYSGNGQDGTAVRPAVTLNFVAPQFSNVRAALAAPATFDTVAVGASDIAALKLRWSP